MNWKRGLNFGQAKYQIIDKYSFIPHIRSGYDVSIPRSILSKFTTNTKNLVALLEVKSKDKTIETIKKLSNSGNSLIFCFREEKNLENVKIKVLQLLSEKNAIERMKPPEDTIKIPTLSILPKFTRECSLPCEKFQNIGSPIYAFVNNSKIITGGFGKKDMFLKKEVLLNELTNSALGLYFAEGGKIEASFTNSHPKIINIFLQFLENICYIDREDIIASICCHPKLKQRKEQLEAFWVSQTGITNFMKNLHLSKSSKSPCGTLELYLCSKVIKEIICGLIRAISENKIAFDAKNITRGILSGDGSPIQQTKTFIVHHIALDRKHANYEVAFLKNIFGKLKFEVKTVPSKINKISLKSNQLKACLYANWLDNYKLLLLDCYRFNPINRLIFANRFLNLPQTKIFMNTKDNEIITGTQIMSTRRSVINLRKEGILKLDQISPKPNRKYIISLSEGGTEVKENLQKFIKSTYPSYVKDILNFIKSLKDFNLIQNKSEVIKDESVLRCTYS